MPNIELGGPYDKHIKDMINSGYFSTTSEIVKDALRDHIKKYENEKRRRDYQDYVAKAIAEGESDIAAGRVIRYESGYFQKKTQKFLEEYAKE